MFDRLSDVGYRGEVEWQKTARQARAEGRTLVDIATELGVAKSSVSLWVRDVPFRAGGPPHVHRPACPSTTPGAARRDQRVRPSGSGADRSALRRSVPRRRRRPVRGGGRKGRSSLCDYQRRNGCVLLQLAAALL